MPLIFIIYFSVLCSMLTTLQGMFIKRYFIVYCIVIQTTTINDTIIKRPFYSNLKGPKLSDTHKTSQKLHAIQQTTLPVSYVLYNKFTMPWQHIGYNQPRLQPTNRSRDLFSYFCGIPRNNKLIVSD